MIPRTMLHPVAQLQTLVPGGMAPLYASSHLHPPPSAAAIASMHAQSSSPPSGQTSFLIDDILGNSPVCSSSVGSGLHKPTPINPVHVTGAMAAAGMYKPLPMYDTSALLPHSYLAGPVAYQNTLFNQMYSVPYVRPEFYLERHAFSKGT